MRIIPASVGALSVIVTSLAWAAGPAGVKLDGTLGGAARVLAGPTYGISQPLGKLAGGNLFFSFQYFNIAAGETALFSTASAGIKNVVSRVTGGYASSINGTIRLDAASGAPDFFLINPSGVTFGPGAVVDVPAAFHVTTADYLKFPDGNFYADPGKQSTLSAAAPQAFGFLGQTRAAVDIQGTMLSAGAGGDGLFQIVAGDAVIDGMGASGGISNTTGDIRVTAVGAAGGEVPISGSFGAAGGTLAIQNGGTLTTSGGGGNAGAIYARSGSLTVDGTNATSRTGILSVAGTAGAAPITVNAAGAVLLTNGGEIRSTTTGPGGGADIAITAESVTVRGSDPTYMTGVETEESATGASGSVSVTAGTLALDGSGAVAVGGPPTGIGSYADLGSSGPSGPIAVSVTGAVSIANGSSVYANTAGAVNAGNISVGAGSMSIVGAGNMKVATGISASALTGSTGVAGVVTIAMPGALTIAKGGEIRSDTAGSGNAGSVSVSAGSIIIDGTGSQFLTGILSLTSGTAESGVTVNSTGSGGRIDVVTAGSVSLLDGGVIDSDSYGLGNAGDVTVKAASLSLDGGAGGLATFIASDAYGAAGSSGNVSIATTGPLSLANGAAVSANIWGSGSGGDVTVTSGSLTINGGTTTRFTGVSSNAEAAATGFAGAVKVTTAGALTITNGGDIASDTAGSGNAGSVSVSVGSIDIDGAGSQNYLTGILSQTSGTAQAGVTVNSTGSAGKINVAAAGVISLLNGGTIDSDSHGLGNAGDVSVTAASLRIDGGTQGQTTYISSDALGATGSGGKVTVSVTGALTAANGGQITSDTYGSGSSGDVIVNAGSIILDGGTIGNFTGISSETEGVPNGRSVNSTGNAGNVRVSSTGALTILDGAGIGSDSNGLGNAGDVSVTSASLRLDGGTQAQITYISSDALGATGIGGKVTVFTTGAMTIANGGEISADTYGAGNGGDVVVKAASMTIDGGTSSNFTGVSSETIGLANQGSVDSTGAAGKVAVNSSGAITILNGGAIASDSGGLGNAGDVSVTAGSLRLDGGTQGQTTYISSDALGATGEAGKVTVSTAGVIRLINGGDISTDTYGAGNGGNVTVTAASISMDGKSSGTFTGISSTTEGLLSGQSVDSTGSAGSVAVTAKGSISIVSGAEISSASNGTGNAGDVTATTGSLSINQGNSTWFTGISTDALNVGSGSTGGIIHVNASGSIDIPSGAIDSLTNSNGAAGKVSISTSGTLSIGGGAGQARIASTAANGSGGQPGVVDISAGSVVIGANGVVSVENDATLPDPSVVTPTQISVQTNTLLLDGGLITAASTGNVDASAIDIRYGRSLRAIDGSISTSAADGNGGPITISGSGTLRLDSSQITTSVSGASGNGGDIDVSVPMIVINTAAIQANTAATRASGGNVRIRADAIVPSFQSFVLGGNILSFDSTLAGLNLIQAAAPDGISGVLNVTLPTLDLGSMLLGLTGRPAPPTSMGRGLCGYTHGSSMSMTGRGGLPDSAAEPLWTPMDEGITTSMNDGEYLPPALPAGVSATRRISGCR